MRLPSLFAASAAFAGCALAGFPAEPEGLTTKQIPGRPGVSITYKETTICETKAKGFAGYVHLPASQLSEIEPSEPYNVSMFFWYFEARENPRHAPTSIYLAGGPGQSSMYGAAESGGPCTILRDSNSTENNPWSFTNNVNMLYIDQPVGSGFSYDTLIKSAQDLLFVGDITVSTGVEPLEKFNGSVPAENATFLYGTFPSQSPSKTANTTVSAAKTLWHFSQVWFSSFPEYKTTDKRISIWGNSYGGLWVPVSADYMVTQNEKIRSGELSDSIILEVDTVGWTNGCTDELYQGEWYPDMAYNNTYGLEVIPEEIYLESKNNYTKENGCRDLVTQCRELGDLYDPEYLGINETVNELCVGAVGYCFTYVMGAYNALSNRSVFDMAHINPDPYPASNLIGFFNQAWVQKELGVPLNFTANSNANQVAMFDQTGDPARIAGMKNVEHLLNSGVKVALVYGDRDYRCPWNGAEHLSLQANWTGADEFRKAGYQYINIEDCDNGGFNGGVVRQHGNLTFSRVFEAGHDAAAFQPRTVFEIFNRVSFNKDVATGTHPTDGQANDYSTKGPSDSFFIKNELPESPAVNCNLYSVGNSCTIEQYEALLNGTAVIENFNIIKPVGGTPGALTNYL